MFYTFYSMFIYIYDANVNSDTKTWHLQKKLGYT